MDERADIFSLGVVFYETLSGSHPFRSGGFLATSDRVLHEEPAPLSQGNPRVPAEVERIVSKMLAKDPSQRYATAADMLVDLRSVQHLLAVPGVHLSPRPAPSRRYVRLLWVLSVVLLLVAGLVWQLLRPAPPGERIRVAVLPFNNQTGDERLDRFRLTMTQMLVLDLTGSPNVQVLPYERLLQIIGSFQGQGKDIYQPEAIQTIANYGNSRFVIVPSM